MGVRGKAIVIVLLMTDDYNDKEENGYNFCLRSRCLYIHFSFFPSFSLSHTQAVKQINQYADKWIKGGINRERDGRMTRDG